MREMKVLLPESALPERWYNIAADMPNRPQPVLHPGTGQPVGPEDLAPLFPMELILQEVSEAPEIPIPEPVRESSASGARRPSSAPIASSRRSGRSRGSLQVRGRLTGGEPQAEHGRRAGVLLEAGRSRAAGHRDRGAGSGEAPWRSPAGPGPECKVYMVKVRTTRSYRRSMMETWGESVVASPSEETQAGRTILEADPDSPGAWASPSPKRSRTLRGERTRPTRSEACSTTSSCTRRSSGRRRWPRWSSRARSPMS